MDTRRNRAARLWSEYIRACWQGGGVLGAYDRGEATARDLAQAGRECDRAYLAWDAEVRASEAGG